MLQDKNTNLVSGLMYRNGPTNTMHYSHPTLRVYSRFFIAFLVLLLTGAGNALAGVNNFERSNPLAPDPADALCYLVADNDGFNNSDDGATFVDDFGVEGFIGMTGTLHIEAITFIPGTGILYGGNADKFGTVNLTTGAFTEIGSFGSGNGDEGIQNLDDIDGLSYDPFSGVMYATTRRWQMPDLLFEVDIATGAAIPDAFGPGKTYVVVPAIIDGPNTLNDIDDIAVSSVDGTMWAILNEDGVSSHLITINKTTGASTDVTLIDRDNLEGLGFHPDGRFLGVLGNGGREIREINPVDGTTTLFSSLGINNFRDYEGIACLTESENKIRGTVYLEPVIDLELTKDVDKTTAQTGESLQYTIELTNATATLPAAANPVTGTATGGITVELWRDDDSDGTVSGGDALLATTVTAGDGTYGFDISSTGDFVLQVDLSSIPNLAIAPLDNIETAVFVGFGNTDNGNDFYFFDYAEATSVSVEDILPGEVSFDSATPSAGSFAGGIWNVGTMTVGASETLILDVTIDTAGTIENCAQVMTAGEDDVDSIPGNGVKNGEDDQDCATTTGSSPEIDLELEKTASQSSAEIGDTFTYTLTVRNTSSNDAHDVIVTDQLPYGVSFVAFNPISAPAIYNAGTHTVTWTVGLVPASGSLSLDIDVLVDGMTGPLPSPFLSDGTYTLRNHPDGNAAPPYYGLRLDKLFGNFAPITFDFDHPSSDMTMEISGSTITISGRAYGGFDTGGSYDHAGIWNVNYSFDSVVTAVSGDDDLEVTFANSGTSIGTISPTYTTAYFNAGDVYNLKDQDNGTRSFRLGNESNDLGHRGFDGISGWGWLQHDGDGNLSHKATSDWLFTAFPRPDELENCAEVSRADETDVDSTPGNAPPYGAEDDDACIRIPILNPNPEIDLELEKTASNMTPESGTDIDYTITITNRGPGTAHNIVVTELLPDAVTFVSASPDAGVYDSNTDTWSIPSLGPGSSLNLVITVTVNINAGNFTGFLEDGIYRLNNHPANQLQPPGYGLRLDELFGGFTGITFDFNDALSAMFMEIDGTTVKIYGQVFGGVDNGAAYDPALSGVWDVEFRYDGVISGVPSDDDLWVPNSDAEVSTGTISPRFTTAFFNASDVFDLLDKSDGTTSFRLGDEDDDNGYQAFSGISGWGWLKHGVSPNLVHVPISDWLFTATPESPSIGNCVEITSVDEDDTDSTPNNGLGNGEDDEACVTIHPGGPRVDLSIDKTVDNADVNVGDNVTFTITLTNDANVSTTATNITVADRLPDDITVLSTTPSTNVTTDPNTNVMSWFVPDLAPGQSIVLEILARVDAPGMQWNCVQVMAVDQDDVDSVPGDGYEVGSDDDACVDIMTPDPYIDLSLRKTVDNSQPSLGEEIVYTLKLKNANSATADALGITVTDDLPAGVTVLSTTPSTNVTFNNTTHTLSWFVPSLAPGSVLTLDILARVDESGRNRNCAEVFAASPVDTDSTPGNADTVNEDDSSCVVTRTPDPTIDLELSKSVDNNSPSLGDTVTYTISVSNPGATESATGVEVTDTLPSGVSFVSANPAVDYDENTGIWTVGTVDPDDTATLEITVLVNAYGRQENCAEITAADQDDMDSVPNNGVKNGEDDQDCATFTTNPVPTDLLCYFVADNDTHTGSPDVLTYLSTGYVEFETGATGTSSIRAIEFIPSTGRLYGADGNRFGTLNPGTGVFSPIGPFGSGTGILGAQTFSSVVGLGLDPFTGVLYGIARRGGEDLLIQIDPFTGSAVANAFGVGLTYVPISSVGGRDNIEDIAIDPFDGTMLGIAAGSGTDHLVVIDKNTGTVTTDLAPLGSDNIRGISFDSGVRLLGVRGSTDREVVDINTLDGTTTHVANLGVNSNLDYESIVCPLPGTNDILGTVFHDVNEDAILDGGDSGQAGVTVELYRDTDNDQIGDFLVGTKASAGDGTYGFQVLSTGDFVLHTVLSTYPSGAVLTTDNIELASFASYGNVDPDNDFGFKLTTATPGSIGDLVFDDVNGNGVFDLGDTGLGGVLVRLYAGACPPTGSPLAVRVTNPSGGYTFNGLGAGTYCVDVVESTIPSGYIHTTANDPMSVVLAAGEEFTDADFGYWFNATMAQADLELTKEVDTSAPALNDIVTFTITVRNQGPADATNLIVRDIIPVGLIYVNATPSKGAYDNANGFWTIGTLPNGATESLVIQMRIVITNMVENIAQVSSVDQPDPDSTPSNGVPSEDDQDNAIVESRGPGSVGDILRVECADMGTINAIAYDQMHDLLFAGSESGNIHISNDKGLNWPLFLSTTNGAPVRDIVFLQTGKVYAGTFGDGVYASSDDGDNWTNIGPTLSDINDLDVDDNSNSVYAADLGRVMRYDGVSWTEVGAPSNPFGGGQVLAVVFDEATNNAFASVAGLGVFEFSGGVWSAVNGGLPIGKINTLFRGPSGEILAGTNSDGVYIFGGATWIKFGVGLDSEPIESLGSGPNGELLAGARESGAYYYNKVTGVWISIGNLPIFTVDSITAGMLGEVYVGAPGEGIYVIFDTDFDGVPDQSQQIANYLTSAVIQGLEVAPNGDMYAATYGYGVLFSNDGGKCWTRMNRGLENLWTFSIARRTDGTLFIGIWADGKGGIWRSRDGGRNWEFLALPDRQIVSLAVDPNNEDIIYAGANLAGVGAIYHSVDGGDTWTQMNSFIQPVWSIAIDPADSDRIVVGTLGDGVYESVDAGLSWNQIGSPANGLDNPAVFDLHFAPATSPYAGQLFAGTDAGVFRYESFTTTWVLFGTNSADYQIRTLAFVGPMIFAGTWNAGVVEYNSGTNEWDDYGLADIPVVAFAVHEISQTLIIGTNGQGLFRSPNLRVATAIENEDASGEVPTEFELLQAYPNPFNPQTSIPFDIRETTRVDIAVFDMLGRKIDTLVSGILQAGRHQVVWEAGNQPSGTYLIRMQTASRVFTKAVVLLK